MVITISNLLLKFVALPFFMCLLEIMNSIVYIITAPKGENPCIFCLYFHSCWLPIKKDLQGFHHQWLHVSSFLFPYLLFTGIYNILMNKEQLFDIKSVGMLSALTLYLTCSTRRPGITRIAGTSKGVHSITANSSILTRIKRTIVYICANWIQKKINGKKGWEK